MTEISITSVQVAAGEAARITGVGLALQRDWRRHGYLPPVAGNKATFDLWSLAEMTFMAKLAQRGIGPQHSRAIAPSVALRIGYFAARERECWCGDIAAVPGETWGEQARLLSPRTSDVGDVARYFVWPAEGGPRFCNSLESFFGWARLEGDPAVAGAVVVMDLESIAGGILDAAGKPLMSVAVT